MKQIAPFFLISATSVPQIPLLSYYLLGGRASIFFVLLTTLISFVGFSITTGHEYTNTLDFSSDLNLFYAMIFNQSYSLLLFLSFQFETSAYHHLLLKSWNRTEEKSTAKTSFISRMSHEIRTPLQGLLSAAGIYFLINSFLRIKITITKRQK